MSYFKDIAVSDDENFARTFEVKLRTLTRRREVIGPINSSFFVSRDDLHRIPIMYDTILTLN
jgi:hypothetical protein